MINLRSYNLQSRGALELKTAGAHLFGGRNNNLGMRRMAAPSAVFNWGSRAPMPSIVPNTATIFNHPTDVAVYADKGALCDLLDANPTLAEYFVPMTKDKAVAQAWLDNGSSVVNRELLNASNGRGITITDPARPALGSQLDTIPAGTLPDVPLYTKYIKKINEYRIHAGIDSSGTSTIICAQRKGRRREAEYVDTRIRNAHDTGAGQWVFLHQDIEELPQAVCDCIHGFQQTAEDNGLPALDFAGYDVVYNRHYDRAYIVEANTAPGIGPRDAQHYMNFFRDLVGEPRVTVPPREVPVDTVDGDIRVQAVVSPELDMESVEARTVAAAAALEIAGAPDQLVESFLDRIEAEESEERLGSALISGNSGDLSNYRPTSLATMALSPSVVGMTTEQLDNGLAAIEELRSRLNSRAANLRRERERSATVVAETQEIDENDGMEM